MENLNAEQVIKALECCIKAECWGDCQELGCPDSTKNGCHFYLRTDDDNENSLYIEMLKDALSLINSQEQRIKELTEENERLRADKDYWKNRAKESESEYDQAVKRGYNLGMVEDARSVAERLHERFHDRAAYTRSYVHDTIDQIEKEMLEDHNNET